MDLWKSCKAPMVVEIKERKTANGWKSSQSKKSMFQPYHGQLKLDVQGSHNQLTVYVKSGRHLSTSNMTEYNYFVKVSLTPGRKEKFYTDKVLDTKAPIFDQKFEFDLQEEDYRRRLYISMWKEGQKKDEMLGCMSFGVLPILLKKKHVNGWYYLLTKELGCNKHLQVTDDDNSSTESLEKYPTSTHTLELRRDKESFGFTVVGSNPVRVGRVNPGSPAEGAGVQKDDQILTINGHDVKASFSHSVARVIRSEKRIKMVVKRIDKSEPEKSKTGSIKKVKFQTTTTVAS